METQVNKPASSPRLKAGPAFAVFVLYIATQILVSIAVGFITALVAALQGANLQEPQIISRISQQAVAFSVITSCFVAGVVTLLFSARRFSQEIKERSPTGAAWVLGTPKSILWALAVGLLIALACLFLSPLMSALPEQDAVGPFTRMANTSGFQRIIVIVIALILAPPVEELLYRGVLFGGFCRSFGALWSAILSTMLFVASHVMEAIHFWPAFIFIGLMASAALWFRLHSKAIGPSVALHFSYNVVILGAAF